MGFRGAFLRARTVAGLLCVFALAGMYRAAYAAEDSTALRDSSQLIAARIVESKVPVLVEFWAAWCKPCKMLAPVLKALEEEYRGRVLFLNVDTERHVRIAAHFRVTTIPVVFIIRDKAVQVSLNGVRKKEEYRKALDGVLAAAGEPADSTGGE